MFSGQSLNENLLSLLFQRNYLEHCFVMAFAHTCKKFILTCTVSVFWVQYSMNHDIVPSSPRRTNLKTNLTRKHIKRFQSTLRRRNLKTNLTRKHIKCFQSTLRQTNLKTNLTRKRINCFQSTLHRRNLKTNLTRKHIKRFQSTLRRRNLKTNLTRKHIKCFQSTLRQTNLKTNLTRKPINLCLRKLSVKEMTQLSWRYHFRKALLSKCFLSTRKQKIPSVWRAFPYSSVFVTA